MNDIQENVPQTEAPHLPGPPPPGGEGRERPPPNPIAGFWRRAFAYILDGVFLGLVGFPLGLLFHDYFAELNGWGRLVGFGIALAYFGILNSSIGNGRTIGKRITGIVVTDGNGKTISLARSFVRFCILGLPYFLNGLPLPANVFGRWSGLVVGFIIFGVGGALIYLFLFNRTTRQSIHDLIARTFVLRFPSTGPIHLPSVWKGHYVVVGLWFGTVILALFLVGPMLERQEQFRELQTVQGDIQSLDGIYSATASSGKTWKWGKDGTIPITSFQTRVFCRKRPENFEKVAEEVASILLDRSPWIREKDRVVVTVSYGFDIGIASGWKSQFFNRSPQEWQEIIDKSRESPPN